MFLFGKKTSLDLGWYPGQLHCSDIKFTHKCPRNRIDIQCASITLTISFPANLYFSVELCLAKVVEGAEAEEKEVKETREDAEEIMGLAIGKEAEEELRAGNEEASQEASQEAPEGGFVVDVAEAPWEGEVVR